MLITSWAMKVKKKAMKLKELSVLQEKAWGHSLRLHPCCTAREGIPHLKPFQGHRSSCGLARGW